MMANVAESLDPKDTRSILSRSQEDRWRVVCAVEDLWEGDLNNFTVDGEQVLLVHLDGGGFRAYQGICPHQGRALGDGDLDGDTLICPGHAWEFDIRTGTGLNPTGCRLFTYPIRVTDGYIQIEVPPPGTRGYYRHTAALENK